QPLLDWLAVDFKTHGWDMKRIVKEIVMSATYRQSAVISPDKLKNDPDNVLLSRGPRNRLPAEFVRDMVLASSGLLNKTIGGPSVNPYQPPGLWESTTSGRGQLASYRQVHGPNLYRRGMYTLIKRTSPPVEMAIFDASNRDQCEVQRLKTNTPLQALEMENDPTMLEAARVLAAKVVQENNQPKDKIVEAFRRIICRKPTEKEMAILMSYYQDQLRTMTEKNADKLLSVGEYPNPPGIDKITQAAMMKVIDAIYNLEEAITKT
ncbi:MAG TPA: DUF1553 domain-containing protein, partial [Mucilaginibacter sp.]|nr:DUF1553 domain-containing protein [Mucilaginibacter sp.]